MTKSTKANINPTIMWFRYDLRIADNPAFNAAINHAAQEKTNPLIALFVLDETTAFPPGGASKWWLHHALSDLHQNLKKRGVQLILKQAQSSDNVHDMICDICEDLKVKAIFWNRRYAKDEINRDTHIKTSLEQKDIEVNSFNGSLLREPWEVKTGSGTHYKVFTPFWRTIKSMGLSRSLIPAPKAINAFSGPVKSDNLSSLKLLPQNPDWAKSFKKIWHPTEKHAHKALGQFLDGAVNNYDDDRNRPDKIGTSRLSPYLAWGQISPLQIWETTKMAIAAGNVNEGQADKFLSEIAWREFSYHLLYFYPELPSKPLRGYFEKFPWQVNPRHLKAWQTGQTGFPIVDAGMRELWQTGWMHNRVRMIVASFLIKDLLIDWREGEKWFWDTLVDGDIASNAASWQWVAGCGADASPYFRIFNPMTQGEKFDPNADYVRKYVPEISKLPNKFIQRPWEASETLLAEAKITLGETYPKPIVDHKQARILALDAYKAIKD